MFWESSKEFIENTVETAVDNRCHDQVTYLPCAVSVPDLVELVTALCLLTHQYHLSSVSDYSSALRTLLLQPNCSTLAS